MLAKALESIRLFSYYLNNWYCYKFDYQIMFLTNGNEVIYLLIYVYPIIVFELLAEPIQL
jgi:hypothetical protein